MRTVIQIMKSCNAINEKMNILTAINHSDCFNQKTQLSILFSMSDLLKNLNPNHYPGFAFSWLELISHR